MRKIIKILRNELIEFTQQMIRIPSFTGDEGDLAKIVLNKLENLGIDETFVDEIGNVIGIIRGEGNGPNILLNGHLDVVPPGNLENWQGFDPFGADIDEEGNIRGRGAADLKGGLSVQMYTMKLIKDLKNQGVTLPGDLIFSAVVHEELAEMFGMEFLLKNTLPEKEMGCDVVFLCEPTNLNLMLGHRGKVELVLTTKGKTSHSSRPHDGINAIQKMVPILEKIFSEIGKEDYIHPLLGERCFAITNIVSSPPGYSIIPDECEISIDQRYFPHEHVNDMVAKYEKIIEKLKLEDPELKVSIKIREIHEKSYTGYQKVVQKHLPPWITDTEDPFVKKSVRALERIGQKPEFDYWEGGTDGSMSKSILGIPTIGYSGMELRFAHTVQDMVNIDKMMLSFEGYYSIVCELFGIEKPFQN